MVGIKVVKLAEGDDESLELPASERLCMDTKLNGKWFLTAIFILLAVLGPRRASAEAFVNADVFGLSTNAVATGSLDLGTISPQNNYFLFPYYIALSFPSNNPTAWGLQLYTDNNSAKSWNPPNGLAGGLRGRTDPTQGIPVYWQIYNERQNAQPAWGTAKSITVTAGGLKFSHDTLQYWGRLYDVNDNDVVGIWMTSDILQRRTIAGFKGLGDFPRSGRTSVSSPIYLYLGLDVSQVSSTQTYGTNLRVDLYNLGLDINQGGYATPNPFTPTTGQKANFNFFLKDINSTFKINIFTIRGRRIRTITDSREWDGRNDQGRLVEGGLYIYQIEAEGRRVSGTVVLIK